MQISMKAAILAGAMTLVSAGANSTVVYSAVADFSGTPTGVWSYGIGTIGLPATFTAMPNFSTACEATAGVSCWQAAIIESRVPMVAKNTTASALEVFDTVVLPTDVLNVHPGTDTDTIVRFTAPTAHLYSVKGFFEVLDIDPNTVSVAITGLGFAATLNGPAASFGTDTLGGFLAFNTNVFLAAGQTLDFTVNKNGSYFNDSTGLSASITAVPEPSTWGLLVVGFGLVGVSARRRNRTAVTA